VKTLLPTIFGLLAFSFAMNATSKECDAIREYGQGIRAFLSPESWNNPSLVERCLRTLYVEEEDEVFLSEGLRLSERGDVPRAKLLAAAAGSGELSPALESLLLLVFQREPGKNCRRAAYRIFPRLSEGARKSVTALIYERVTTNGSTGVNVMELSLLYRAALALSLKQNAVSAADWPINAWVASDLGSIRLALKDESGLEIQGPCATDLSAGSCAENLCENWRTGG